jgi:methionyl-tRNA formyltransferase
MALAAFAALVPKNVLELTPGGILNVHPSLLPRWRGAAPIQSALLAGDSETGVSIIRLVQALDAGPIVVQERVAIAPEDDYVSLEPRLAELGARLLVQAIEQTPTPEPQDDSAATFSRKIERDDARIDWAQPNTSIWNQVRAYRGWPQAFTTLDGKILKILRAWPVAQGAPESATVPGAVTFESSKNAPPVAATGSGSLRLDEVQLEGRRAQSGEEFLRGYPKLVGTVLGGSVA